MLKRPSGFIHRVNTVQRRDLSWRWYSHSVCASLAFTAVMLAGAIYVLAFYLR